MPRTARPVEAGTIEHDIYRFIIAYKISNDGASPTIRNIGEAFGIDSTSMIAWYLNKLERNGMIKRDNRRIQVIGGRYIFEGTW